MTAAQAAAELDQVAAQLAAENPKTNRNRRFAAVPVQRYLIGEYSHDYVTMLFWAVIFVLLIACSNLAVCSLRGPLPGPAKWPCAVRSGPAGGE